MVETFRECRSIKDPDLLEPHNGSWDKGKPFLDTLYPLYEGEVASDRTNPPLPLMA
jgi:hypothetical protein